MNQQKFIFNGNNGPIKIIQGGTQSKDKIEKARFEPNVSAEIRAFCQGRKITPTDFLREYSQLGSVYFDHIELLRDKCDEIIPLLENWDEVHDLLKKLSKFF